MILKVFSHDKYTENKPNICNNMKYNIYLIASTIHDIIKLYFPRITNITRILPSQTFTNLTNNFYKICYLK
jgi:hypothetical protein